MSIKDKIKEVLKKKAPEGQLDSGPKVTYTSEEVEEPIRKETSYKETSKETPLTPEDEAKYWGIYQKARIEYSKTPDPKNRSKFYQRDLSDEEERMLQRMARKQASESRYGPEAEMEREAEFAKAGVPKTEWKKGWEKKPGEKKSSEVWREVSIPEYVRRRIAAEQPYVEATYGLQAQRAKQGIEAERELYPWEKEIGKHTLAEKLESAQSGLSQTQFEREQLQPKAQSLQLWEAEKAIERMKKEQFARTKKGRTLKTAGKILDSAASGLSQGIGYGALGMGMALRSGPSVDTAYLTGRYTPRNVNMQTPASQMHGQTWVQAGRSLIPTSKSPAGRALGATNVPAGAAILPNLQNLNPAISMRRMLPGLSSSRLSPLPRRRQTPQQTEPGISRVR